MGQTELDLSKSPGTFGNVHFSQNNNAKLSGSENGGSVFQNSNLHLSCTKCTLDLTDNSNAKIKAEFSNLTLFHCMNVNLFGRNLNSTLKDNSNVKVRGETSELEAVRNTNMTAIAKDSHLKLVDNTNIDIDAGGGSILAEKNINLKVSGHGGRVEVRDTENHELRQIKNSANNNRVEVSVSSKSRSVLGSWFSWPFSGGNNVADGTNNVKFTLDYVDEAVVTGSEYKLGHFQFSIRKAMGMYEVKVDPTLMDRGIVETERLGSGDMLLRGSKGGVSQCLKFKAPVVTQKEDGLAFDISVVAPPAADAAEMSSNI